MRRFFAVAGLVAVFTVPMVATAANLSNGSSQTCPAGQIGTWHFVNNQTGGAAAGTLTAIFSSGTVVTVASAVLQKTQHFNVSAAGTLIDASTNLPGKLVLSDFSCEEPKKG